MGKRGAPIGNKNAVKHNFYSKFLTQTEKLEIAKRHLVPKQKEAHGLGKVNFKIADKVLEKVIEQYTRESGVRELDRQIASIENRAIFTTPDLSLIVNKYDNHQLHVESHRMFRKEPEYQKLKFENYEQFIYVSYNYLIYQ